MPSVALIASSLRVADGNLLFETDLSGQLFSLLLKELFYLFIWNVNNLKTEQN